MHSLEYLVSDNFYTDNGNVFLKTKVIIFSSFIMHIACSLWYLLKVNVNKIGLKMVLPGKKFRN